MIYELEINMLPPAEYSLNSRAHWSQRHRAGAEYSQAVFYCAIDKRNKTLLAGETIPIFHQARLELTFVFPQLRTRDGDNLLARFKPGLDALVKAEVLTGDDLRRVLPAAPVVVIDKARAPLTIVRLIEC